MPLIKKKIVKVAKVKVISSKYEAKAIGETVAKVMAKKSKYIPKKSITYQKDLKKDFMKRLTAKKNGLKYSNKEFNSMYRGSLDGYDELFSTALTRDFVEGILKAKNYILNPAERDKLNKLVDQMSDVRIPTKYSGFSLKEVSMQHPTSGKEGIFSSTKGTASEHSYLDRKRREYVENAMKNASKVSSFSAEDIVREGIKASIEFTLNYFTAPIEASDVKPFSLALKYTKEQVSTQMKAREYQKEKYVEYGGSLRIGAESNKDIAERRARLTSIKTEHSLMPKRSPSPFRGKGTENRAWIE